MAGLLSRFTNFVPNTTILSNDHNQELNRIVNLLNGTTTNLKTALKTSDAGDPPLELDQLSTGPILKGFQGGIEKFRFRNDGALRTPGVYDSNDNEELLFVATASAVNEFTMTNAATAGRPKLSATGGDTDIGLDISPKGAGQVFITGSSPLRLPTGISPSNDDDAARKKYVDDKVTAWEYGWIFPVVTGGSETIGTEPRPAFICPPGTSITITQIRLVWRAGSHTGGTSTSFQVYRENTDGSGASSMGTITVDNGGPALMTESVNDIGDVVLTTGQRLVGRISANSGADTIQNVTLAAIGTQKLT